MQDKMDPEACSQCDADVWSTP